LSSKTAAVEKTAGAAGLFERTDQVVVVSRALIVAQTAVAAGKVPMVAHMVSVVQTHLLVVVAEVGKVAPRADPE
jgi:hypothetical protein